MKPIPWGLALLGSFSLSACMNAGNDLAAADTVSSLAESTVQGVKVGLGPSFDGRRSAFYGNPANQYFEFGAEYNPGDPTYLAIHDGPPYTLASFGRPIVTESQLYGASFEIAAVAPKTKDHYYVAGRDGASDVVELWKRKLVTVVNGGTSSFVMKRTRLYRGPLGGVRCISVDHLARFLLIVHGTNPVSMSKLALPSGGTPVLLFTDTQIPALASVNTAIWPRRHTTHGIVWTLQNPFPVGGVRNTIMLFDNQDDGAIDSWTVLDQEAYSSDYSVFSELWTDSFMTD